MIQPPSCLDVPPSMFCPGVFTSVLLQPSAPPPRSLIFHPLHPLTAVEKAGCSTYFKQGGSQRRRSSHLIPATGLRRSHKHVGLLSCFFSQFWKKKESQFLSRQSSSAALNQQKWSVPTRTRQIFSLNVAQVDRGLWAGNKRTARGAKSQNDDSEGEIITFKHSSSPHTQPYCWSPFQLFNKLGTITP